MLQAYYPQRRGDFFYDVTVTKDDSVPSIAAAAPI